MLPYTVHHVAQLHWFAPCMQVKALQQAETCVTEQRKACEDVRAEWSATQHELSMLHSTHLNDTDKAEKQISKLENELQAAMLHVSRVESDLKDSLAKQARAEDTIESLTTAIEGLQNQLHAGTEQINNLTSELQSKTAAFDALTAEHQSSIDKCQLLCTSLQQSEEQMQARCAELEQAVTASESEEIAKVRLTHGCSFLCCCLWVCLATAAKHHWCIANIYVYRMPCHVSLNRKQRR